MEEDHAMARRPWRNAIAVTVTETSQSPASRSVTPSETQVGPVIALTEKRTLRGDRERLAITLDQSLAFERIQRGEQRELLDSSVAGS